jgi:hypothetical protein
MVRYGQNYVLCMACGKKLGIPQPDPIVSVEIDRHTLRGALEKHMTVDKCRELTGMTIRQLSRVLVDELVNNYQ